MEHLVIIGGVAAGTKAAAKARRENPDLKITLFTDEDTISYSACGLPYFIKDVIKKPEQLIARTPEAFAEKENVSVFIRHRAIEISPRKKQVLVQNLQTGDSFKEDFTKLLIATGASPIVPNIEGIGAKNVFTIRSITDGIIIKEKLQKSKKAIIVGGGYIGLELHEAFLANNVETKLIEKQSQLMPSLDEDIALNLYREIEKKYPNSVILNDGVQEFITENNELKAVKTDSGKTIEADMAVLAIGVKPNVELAKAAGIELGKTGAIKVNNSMQTNFDYIYAAGDCAEKTQMQINEPIWIPLGSTANKEGRVAGSNIAGMEEKFNGILGSAVTRFFDFNVSMTGLTEKQAKQFNLDYVSTTLSANDKAGYMPDVKTLSIKILAEKKTNKLLGVQAIGHGNIDKTVNMLATALRAGMTVSEYTDVDISYAPPFSKAIDITTVAAYVLKNKLENKVKSVNVTELNGLSHDEHEFLIAQNEDEATPSGKYKNIIVLSYDSMQSYITAKKLEQKGFNNVKFVEGCSGCLDKCLDSFEKRK